MESLRDLEERINEINEILMSAQHGNYLRNELKMQLDQEKSKLERQVSIIRNEARYGKPR